MVVADTPRGLMVLPKEKPERPGRVERERKKKLEEDEKGGSRTRRDCLSAEESIASILGS